MNRLLLLMVMTSLSGFLMAQATVNTETANYTEKGCQNENLSLTVDCPTCGGAPTWEIFNFFANAWTPAPPTLNGTIIIGQGTNTLTIQGSDATPNNLNNISFRANFITDAIISPEATLEINANPGVVDVVDGPLLFCASNSDVLSADLTASSGLLTYQWTKDGVDIPGAINSTYSPIWADGDDGAYNVEVTADGCMNGEVDVTDTDVVVNARPSSVAVAGSPADLIYCEDEAFTLMSMPTPATPSSGTYTYQWTQDGTAIGAATMANYGKTAVLADAGTYRVEVNINGCEALAPTQSSTADAMVVEGVNITEVNFDDEAITGDGTGTATFSAEAENVDAATDVTWVFDGVDYPSGAGMTTTFNDVVPANGNGNTFDLTITNVVAGDMVTSTFEATDKTTTASGGGGYDLPVVMEVANNSECVAVSAQASTMSNASVLPIELVNFAGQLINKNVVLDWVTSSEINNAYFTIERSLDAKTFTAIGEISGAGTTSEKQSYTFRDDQFNNNGLTYYRLKQTDFDGGFSYADVISIRTSADDALVIGQVAAANETLTVELNSVLEENVNINIFDMSGRLLLSTTEMIYAGQNEINLATSGLNNGIFLMNVQTKTQNLTQKFVK